MSLQTDVILQNLPLPSGHETVSGSGGQKDRRTETLCNTAGRA